MSKAIFQRLSFGSLLVLILSFGFATSVFAEENIDLEKLSETTRGNIFCYNSKNPEASTFGPTEDLARKAALEKSMIYLYLSWILPSYLSEEELQSFFLPSNTPIPKVIEHLAHERERFLKLQSLGLPMDNKAGLIYGFLASTPILLGRVLVCGPLEASDQT